MKTLQRNFVTGLLSFLTLTAPAATRYVNVNGTNPILPYIDWGTAATNIQDAIDAAVPGEQVLVTNGVYQTGGTSNRVAINKAITVQSVNGPSVTAIRGSQAMRCVYMTNSAALIGFTLADGNASHGGGLWCESTNAFVSSCVLSNNRAGSGGGAYRGTLTSCVIVSNSVPVSPVAFFGGGGVYGSVLSDCTLTGNVALEGGGAYSSTLNNCMISGNVASEGGGAASSTLRNCVLTWNSAWGGGGVHEGTLNNCTLIANTATSSGGGASSSTLRNCIVFYNTAPGNPNYSGDTLTYCCATPQPAGSGNISAAPRLADMFHLSTGSPCIGRGSFAFAGGVDADGEPWANPPSIGCDEYHAGTVTGELSVAIQASYTNVSTGFVVSFTGQINGHPAASRWDYGDGTVVSNQLLFASHSWLAAGDYAVALWAYNDSYPTGVFAGLTLHVVENPVHYVALNCANPIWPYLTWATAATNIQDAVDAAFPVGTVIVSNGTYRTGGRVSNGPLTNRVAVTKPLTLRSVNGPDVTIIQGNQVPGRTNGDSAVRCVYLTNGASFSGFKLVNGATRTNGDAVTDQSGGGLLCATNIVISNCVFMNNAANQYGGGAYQGILRNCTLLGNYAALRGGGAAKVTLQNCMLVSNSASYAGGGAYASTLSNCVLSFGSGRYSSGGAESGSLVNCLLLSNRSVTVGGATDGATLNLCALIGNSSANGGAVGGGTINNSLLCANTATDGGATWYATLNQCTVVSNSAANSGGGVHGGKVNNSILYYNNAAQGPNYADASLQTADLTNCCTTPLPNSGSNNISSPPMFVDLSTGNLRLQSNSPCINAGSNSSANGSRDLDERPRIVGGTVDIGAYEFQAAGVGEFIAWLKQFNLPTSGSADFSDGDGDSHNNWQEWKADTNPTNSQSGLRMLSAASDPSGILVQWASTNSRTYFLERAADLASHPAFSALSSNISGQVGTTTYTDTNAIGNGPFFYRIGVQE